MKQVLDAAAFDTLCLKLSNIFYFWYLHKTVGYKWIRMENCKKQLNSKVKNLKDHKR